MLLKVILLAIGVAFVIGVMSIFGFNEIIASLLAANIYLVILAVALQVLTVFIYAVRLNMLVKKCCYIRFSSVFKITLIGIVVNCLTPFVKVGGEPA
ncbi:MAG: lysylphosphatidylglycerol synthase domain-containing protein, partial [Candidatus Aenigmatarchaeota archaeon]